MHIYPLRCLLTYRRLYAYYGCGVTLCVIFIFSTSCAQPDQSSDILNGSEQVMSMGSSNELSNAPDMIAPIVSISFSVPPTMDESIFEDLRVRAERNDWHFRIFTSERADRSREEPWHIVSLQKGSLFVHISNTQLANRYDVSVYDHSSPGSYADAAVAIEMIRLSVAAVGGEDFEFRGH